MIPVFLTPEEADLFVKFREHQDSFTKLVNSGALDVKNGQVVLHYNSFGELVDININVRVYHKG